MDGDDVARGARRRPSGWRLRLAGVVVAWAIAIEVIIWAVAEGTWGRVVYYLGGSHGIHEGDVVLVVGSIGLATLVTVVLLWPVLRRGWTAGASS